MKKIATGFMITFVIISTLCLFMPYTYANQSTLSTSAYSTPFVSDSKGENDAKGELVDMKSKMENELQEYEEKYGSKAYGYTAYILNKIRIFSIPLCFVGIAVGSIYQYVIGIRKLDVQDKGFALIIGFVTVLVICQLLPLIFAIVVQGWRG